VLLTMLQISERVGTLLCDYDGHELLSTMPVSELVSECLASIWSCCNVAAGCNFLCG